MQKINFIPIFYSFYCLSKNVNKTVGAIFGFELFLMPCIWYKWAHTVWNCEETLFFFVYWLGYKAYDKIRGFWRRYRLVKLQLWKKVQHLFYLLEANTYSHEKAILRQAHTHRSSLDPKVRTRSLYVFWPAGSECYIRISL